MHLNPPCVTRQPGNLRVIDKPCDRPVPNALDRLVDHVERHDEPLFRLYRLAKTILDGEVELHNINRTRMENIFHRLFSTVQLDLTIEDRFGKPVKPKEWFVVPLHVIDEAVERIRDGAITGLVYDPKIARLASDSRMV